MKLSTALITGMFISISALFFFRQEEKLFYFLWGKEARADAGDKEKEGGKEKKKTTHIPVKKKTGKLTNTDNSSWQQLFAVPSITAVKTVDKTTNALPGDLLNYTVVITNNGGSTESNLNFTDNVDPNTTVVAGSLQTSPVAFDDNYTSIGNVGISVPDAAGILANDATGTNPAATFTPVTNAATTQGGTISINAAGGISYTPAAGFTGNDTYTYTLSNAAGSSTATISIAVSGMIWFINSSSVAATADGRLNTPFKSVSAFQAVNNGTGTNPGDNQNIFVFENAAAYTGNITLRNGQKLIGQDATASLATITGYTGFTYSTPLLPAMASANVDITQLTSTGTDDVVALNGGSSGSYLIRGLTIGNKVSGSGISGTSFGTLNVSEVSIKSGGRALNLNTGALNATLNDLTSTSGVNGVSLTSITGTLSGGGALSGNSGPNVNIDGGSVSFTFTGNITQGNNAAMVNVSNGHTGTLTFNTGTLNASAGTGLQFDNADGTYSFNGTNTLNGGDAGIDLLNDCDGTFTFSNLSTITNPTGTAFNIGSGVASSGGNSSVTYNGTITKTTSGKAVEIQNKGGGTVAFTGNINGAGSSGINMATNPGAIINFTGGLSLSTSGSVAFNATGGGTVSATQNNSTIVNTLTTTTATALNVVNTTIGASGLAFRSINVGTVAGGPITSGITLNNTGTGGLTVTGNGAAGSGGTIRQVERRGVELITAQNISLTDMELLNANTGDAGFVGVCEELANSGCYAALYGSAVTTLQLTRVNVTTTAEQGINLNNVTGLTIANCFVQGNGDANEEGALKVQDLKGTCSITNSTFKNSANRIAHIRNSSGSVNLTVSGCQFVNDATNLSAVKQDCFQMRLKNSTSATVSITNTTFKRAGTAAVNFYAEDNSTANLTITNCTADREGQLMKGIDVGSDHTAHMYVNVDDNSLLTAKDEVSLNITSTGTTSVTNATARNNIIKGGNSPSTSTFVQLNLWATQTATNNVVASGNNVSELDGRSGIESFALHSQPGAGTSQMNATIKTNTVVGTSNVSGNGIRVTTSATGGSGAASNNCSEVASNNVTIPSPLSHFRVTNGAVTSTIRLPGTGADATAIWNNGGNTPASPPAVVTFNAIGGSTTTFGGVPCPQPSGTPQPLMAAVQEPTELPLNAIETDAAVQPTEETTAIAVEAATTVVEPAPQTLASETVNTAVQSVTETVTPTNITVAGIALPPSKSITIKFQVQVNNPLPAGTCSLSNQGSVSGGSGGTVQTDNDADLSNGINPTVTLVKDELPPVVNNCPSTITVQTGTGNTTCTQTATWTEPTATDNCSGALTFFSRTHAPGSSFNLGTTTVTYVFKDASGNQATCAFDVVVQDNTPPTVSGCPSTITVQTGTGNTTCTQTATWTEPTATDNCTGGSIAYFSRSHAPGASFSKGTTTVTYVFKDAAGNERICTFDVVVQDNTPPVVANCPGNITVNTGTGNTTCTQTATWTEPTASDACDGSVAFFSRSHAPGASFSKGTTAVTYVFKDAAGNESTCSFNVTVVDNTPPVLTCPGNISVIESAPGSGSAIVNYPAATASDNCSGIGAIQYSQASGTSFPLGSTQVNVSVQDAVGNTANCSFTVTVTPACQITPPANVTENSAANQCGANVSYPAATTTGDCGTLNYSKASGSFFPVGTTTVTVSSPSTGQTASFTVKVVDNTLPTITGCPSNITVQTGIGSTACSKAVSWTAPTASDNCAIQSFTSNKNPGDVFPVGMTTVTYTAVDVNGKQNTCSFTVTVQDNTPPVISGCPTSQTVQVSQAGCSQTVTWIEPTATDNCTTPLNYYFRSHAPGSNFGAGTTAVTYKFKDAAGNESICTFNVTVNGTLVSSIPDAFAYTPGTVANRIYVGWTQASKITYTASVSGGQPPFTYKWTTSAAALSIQGSSTQSSVVVTSTTPGTYTLTLKVTDNYGCTSTATKSVTVGDIRCGKKLDMVSVCQRTPAGTICVAPSAVASLLAQGATLGACGTNVITKSAPQSGVLEAELQRLSLSVLPNPSYTYFTVKVKGDEQKGKVLLKVVNVLGQVVEMRNNVQMDEVIRLGDGYKAGAYLIEVSQGDNRQQLKVIKM